MTEQIIEIDDEGRVLTPAMEPTDSKPVDRRNAKHIRRAVLAAHAAVLRSLNARSRRAQLKNGRAAMGELVTILEVLPAGEWPPKPSR